MPTSGITGIILSGGLAVTANTVATGKCLIRCTRTSATPNEDLWVVFENTTAVTINTSGTTKVWVQIPQANINDGTLNTNSDGTNIGSIQTGASYPSSNYVPLASVTSGVITDARPSATIAGLVVQGILKYTESSAIASATTTDLSTATGNVAHITGTTTITALGTLPAGTQMITIFDGALILTYNATSLILPSLANITTAV